MQDCNVLSSKLKSGKLSRRKIIKIVATRCHILKLKCVKFDFGWCSVPDLAGGAYKEKGREGNLGEWKGKGRVSRIFSSVCWQP